jgi:hypothetical protein
LRDNIFSQTLLALAFLVAFSGKNNQDGELLHSDTFSPSIEPIWLKDGDSSFCYSLPWEKRLWRLTGSYMGMLIKHCFKAI